MHRNGGEHGSHQHGQPLTAGAVAVVREYLRTRKPIAVPSAALLKGTKTAILEASKDRIGIGVERA